MSQDNHTDAHRLRRNAKSNDYWLFRQIESHQRCAEQHRRLVFKKANIIHTAAAVLAFMVAIGPRRPNAHLNGKTNLRHAIQNGQDRLSTIAYIL